MVNKQDAKQNNNSLVEFRLKPLSACIRLAIASGALLSHALPINAELPQAAQNWAAAGVATKSVTGNVMNIQQKVQRAELNWNSFNVGTKNTVNFNQPNAQAIALNRIADVNPSAILGKVNANGQVYLYNSNGFIFGKDSVIDTNTLVATTLDFNKDVFNGTGGISSIDGSVTSLEGTPSANSAINIAAGAKIHAGQAGRIIMAAPTVTNNGNLSTDKYGQIILVASKDKVYLTQRTSNPNGLVVEVGTGGAVTNGALGNILARQGDVTLAGFAVNQDGLVSATTAVNVNGSIHLLAEDSVESRENKSTVRSADLGDKLGTQSSINFGSGSKTQIVADSENTTAVDGTALNSQPVSNLEAIAYKVHMKSNSAIGVPGGKVSITAKTYQTDEFGNNKKEGRIVLDSGASIDVSGSKTITAPVSRNVVEVPVQSYELRNSPYQQGGVLKGQTVRVDIRDKIFKDNKGIVDISGGLARIERGIDERLGNGGTVNLTANDYVAFNKGASINISGGIINYQSGFINTTKLITDYGAIVDIADADPRQHYKGIYGVYTESHDKWGITDVWQTGGLGEGRFEQAYQQGLDAGKLSITAPAVSWNGDLVANAASGLYQRNLEAMAHSGELTIDTTNTTVNATAITSADLLLGQNVLFQARGNGLNIGIDKPFPTDTNGVKADLVLSTEAINRSGLQKLTVNTPGKAEIAPDANIALVPGGATALSSALGESSSGGLFELKAAGGIDVKGNVYVPGGNIRLTSGYIDNNGTDVSAYTPINVAAGAALNVSGRWVNDFALGLDAIPKEPIAINAGSVNLVTLDGGRIHLQQGSAIKADGGAWLAQNQQLTAGAAGSISLDSSQFPAEDRKLPVDPQRLVLEGTLSAYGLSSGGSLSINTLNNINIGNTTEPTDQQTTKPLQLGITDGHLDLDAGQSFADITLKSSTDVALTKQTAWSLKQQNWLLDQDYRQRGSDRSLAAFSTVETLPDYLRKPVDLTLSAINTSIDTGSKITADPQATIKLVASSNIYVDGVIDAPAGDIELLAVENSFNTFWLGQHGQLLARGTTVLNPPDALGRRTGSVLDGGSVTLEKDKVGNFVLEQGSLIDVSGTQTTLDLPTDNPSGLNVAPMAVASNGGKISLSANTFGILDGSLKATAGGASASGGRLDLHLNGSSQLDSTAVTINVRQNSTKILPNNIQFGDGLSVGADLLAQFPAPAATTISSEQITRGGFDDVRLSVRDKNSSLLTSEYAAVNFLGDINLATKARIDIDAPTIGWQPLSSADKGIVNLNTAYFRAGTTDIKDYANNYGVTRSPQSGGIAQFTARTKWTELGGESFWDGFKAINLDSSHDLRTVGVLDYDVISAGNQANPLPGSFIGSLYQGSGFSGKMVSAADINITASQVYPATLTKFTFAVENSPNGKITVTGNGNTDAAPLSAAGNLTFKAPVIQQNGILKALFGNINLLAGTDLTLGKGSITSVSGAGQLVPFGTTFSGADWLYPVDSINLVYDQPPEKKLVLSAPKVTLAKGSTVDVAGGGDLLAYEFQKGLSGDNDYLQLADDQISYGRNGGFAILPSLGSALAPYDPFQSASFTEGVGSQIYLSGTGKLAAGFYTLLPSHYALLPGAFLVTPQDNTQDQRTTTYDQAGIPTVAGYHSLASTGTRDARWSGFLLENGADIRKNSKYDEQTANSFFARTAIAKETSVPLLPNDSGQVVIKDVQTKLALEGDIKSASPSGKGARLDISANRLKIVKALSTSPVVGEVELLADNLTNLNVGSLLLGGERSINSTSKATDINVTAEQVSFESNTQVHVTDLAAAATGQVIVKNNATLIADGIVNTGDKQFNIKGDGALLRVSADKQITLSRTGSQGATGDLLIEKGAKLSASKSMLLDGSHTSELAGDILMKSGSLYLGGNAMNIGEVNGLSAAGAINLSNDRLASLTVDELLLNSQTGINFYGDVGKRDSAGLLQPLSFKRLVMNSPELSGYGSAKQTVNIKADNLLVQNTSGTDVIGHGSGVGKLAIAAENYSQGSGNVGINGFNSAAITVAKGFTATGDGSLTVDADLFLTSGYLTANGGNVLAINAVGHQLQMTQIANAIIPDITSYGGVIKVTADSINFNARALLPSGTLALHSLKGNLLVGPQAGIDLAGRKVGFADTYAYTPGGKFNATADLGKITLAENSNINADTGGGKAAGGKLVFAAFKQNVEILKGAKLSAKTGSATFDVGGFNANSSFDNLMDTLLVAGVTDSISLRSRQADIVQQFGHSITANQINLASDQGAISLAGKLVADGEKGGSVKLFAGDMITLQSGAVVSAKSTVANAKGGDVLLSSTNADLLDKLSGIRIDKDALIDVSGSGKDNGGKVILRALRKGSDDIDINPIAGTVKGFSVFYADAVRKYDNSDFSVNGQILTANINDIKDHTDQYMEATTLLKVSNRLGSGIRLRPGVEIDYEGDLNLKDLWDLNGWKYADASGKSDVVGVLTIKATGNLSFENALTDGFVRGNTSTGEVKDILQSNDSWSYQLTAGADLSSANATTVVAAGAGAGKNITLATNTAASTDPSIVNTVIRTGTGDIELAASGNLAFGDKTSLYNAGKASATNPYGTLGDVFTNAEDFTRPPQYYGGDYSQAGGDLVINVGRDIKGALSQNVFLNFVDDGFGNATPVSYWLNMQGNNWANPLITSKEASAWAVDFIKFDQNVGSFGGGKVAINAGHDINDLAVMMPTTGKQVGEKSVSADGVTTWLTNKLQINGGGELRVNAEGDVAGGVYYLAQGKGSIHADGAVTGSSAPNASITEEVSNGFGGFTTVNRRTILGLVDGPQLLQGGNAQLFVDATQAVNVYAPADPLALGGVDRNHSFYSYGPDSSLSLSSLAEDIKLSGVSPALLGVDLQSDIYYQYSPASLFATAFGGNFRMANAATMTLFPSQRGQLSILAKQNIDSQLDATNPGSGAITMLDYDPNSLPNAYAMVSPSNRGASLENKSIHVGDAEPVRLVTQQGDIRDLALTLPKKAIISSGHDLVNVSVNTEHANPSGDTTVITAARDITYPTLRDKSTGVLDLGSGEAIKVAGQGNVLVQAGRNIDLGSKDGIVTVGNAGGTYKNLLKTGANITVMAGLNGGVANYLGVSKLNQDVLKYAGNFNKVQQLVTDFMRNRTGNTKLTTKAAYDQFKKLNEAEYPALKKQLDALRSNQYTDVIANIKAEIVGFVRQSTNNNALTETQALQAFAKLKPDQYLAIQPKLNTLTNQILFSELNQTGTASAGDPTAGNVRGFDAIAALYPGNAWKGDINLVYSNIKTTAGGNIDLIAPGGGINVGLASPPSVLTKASDNLGIIANQQGNINAFVKDNIAVNESRVFALGDGNIMLWSSEGNIDAGRGAKSALSIPPPVFGFDNDGNLVVEFPNPSSGSGIRTAKPIYSAGKQGDVGLFAPGGIVDAGEAGIGGNNVTISATAVLGANNIQVGGVSTGVPAASTGSVVAGLTGVSNLSANVSQMAQASADLGKDDDKKKNKKLGRINVDLIGFGA